MSSLNYDTVIVGGGIIGSSIAFQLAKRGARVVMLEKEKMASQASSAAAGMLGAQSEFSSDSPLIPLALKSRAMFPSVSEELKQLTGIDIGLVQKGLVKIAFTDEEFDALQEQYHFWDSRDAHVNWLDQHELKQLERNVTEDFKGAMYIRNDGQVRAPDLSRAFSEAAKVYGAEMREHKEAISLLKKKGRVNGVKTENETIYADSVVIAGGAWSAQLVKDTNLDLNMYPVKGECLSVLTETPLLETTMFSKDGCYIVPKQGNRLLIGATSIPHTFKKAVSVKGIYSLLKRAQMMIPKLSDASLEKVWSGIRPQTEDGLPFMGEHPQIKGMWVATGHYRNGILLSPITGVLFADLIEGKQIDFDLSSFQLTRNAKNIITT
ncbi:glycine oxidase ThiO [Bacillus sp. FJAT-47783]|uniref:glycine oxidase ThiO n=1 Tax=Bacillus sp. FJAT-47783 TaxID=2922712 RepID=UPI001FACBF26|nr:glycine oxidase ThiO [Bacillus sp. FJAT-47783]